MSEDLKLEPSTKSLTAPGEEETTDYPSKGAAVVVSKRRSFFRLFDPCYESPKRVEDVVEKLDQVEEVDVIDGLTEHLDDVHICDEENEDVEKIPTPHAQYKGKLDKSRKIAEQFQLYENLFESFVRQLQDEVSKNIMLEAKNQTQLKSYEHLETAFLSIAWKYDKSKEAIAELKQRESSIIEKQFEKYQALKQEVIGKINAANEVNIELKKNYDAEIVKLNAKIEQLVKTIASLENGQRKLR